MAAATTCQLIIVEKTLRLGVNPDNPSSLEFHGAKKALHKAVEDGWEDIVRLLLSSGDSPRVKCSLRTTPF
jgi:hypothetical protein